MKYSALYATSKWAQVASHNQILIRYDDGRIAKQSRLHQASPWRATLTGLIEAISVLPEGSHVKLITDLDMGVGRLERSINHDLKRIMVETLNERSCTFEFLNVACANSLWNYIDAA